MAINMESQEGIEMQDLPPLRPYRQPLSRREVVSLEDSLCQLDRTYRIYRIDGHGGFTPTRRFYDWLNDLPDTITPQQRYEQGLDLSADHPLHPHVRYPVTTRQRRTVERISDLRGEVQVETYHEEACYMIYRSPAGIIGKTPLDSTQNKGTKEDEVTQVEEERVKGTGQPVKKPAQLVRKRNPDTAEEDEEEPVKKRARYGNSVSRLARRLSSALMLSPKDFDTPEAPEAPEAPKKGLSRRYSTMFPYLMGEAVTPFNRSKSVSEKNSKPARETFTPPAPLPQFETVVEEYFPNPDVGITIAVMGDAMVGKTALIAQYLNHGFDPSYTANALTRHVAHLSVAGVKVKATIDDLGSVQDAKVPHPLACEWYDAVIVCFDVGNQKTVASVEVNNGLVHQHLEKPIVVLAGLRVDLRKEIPALGLGHLHEKQAVSAYEAEELAARLHVHQYMECSARRGQGIDALFDFVVRAALAKRQDLDKKMAAWRVEHLREKRMEKLIEKTKSFFGVKTDEKKGEKKDKKEEDGGGSGPSTA